jgi:hypothetical protein
VDLDGDGHRDILSGSYSRMESAMAGLFQILWGQADGSFKKAAVLNGTDGEPLIIPVEKEQWVENICTRPFAVDWDNDGDLDLVVGNFTGTFYLFKGEGKGKFVPQPEQIKSGDVPLKIEGHHSDPFVVDWDADGDVDLLSGSSQGGVQWSENRAGRGKLPQLAAFQPLIPPGPPVAYPQVLRAEELKGPLDSTRVWADDLNSDGKLDILVGDLATLVSPAGNLTENEMKAKFAEWMKSVQEASKLLNSDFKDEKERTEAYEQYRKLYAQRSEFMNEDRTGFVWLYLQK